MSVILVQGSIIRGSLLSTRFYLLYVKCGFVNNFSVIFLFEKYVKQNAVQNT